MKTHLFIKVGMKSMFLSIVAMLFSFLSFSQSVVPGFDGDGNYVILTKYTGNGDLDLSYGINGSTVRIPINFFSAVYQPDGKVILIGNTRDVYIPGDLDIHWDIRLVRVNADGTLDPTFGTDGILTIASPPQRYEEISSVDEMQGKIFIAFVSTSIVGQNKSLHLLLFDYNENTFTTLVVQPFDYFADAPPPLKILTYDDTKTLVATGATIYRFNDDGQPDLSFNGIGRLNLPDVPGQSTVIRDVLIYNGRIIAGATSIDPETNLPVFKVYVFNSDGTPDISFGTQGVQTVPISGEEFVEMYVDGSTLYVISLSAINTYPLDETIPVTFTCPSNKVVSTDADQCSAVVNDIDPVITPVGSSLQINYSLSGATSGEGEGSVSGKVFNTGTTTITYSITGNPSATCSFTVEVQDTHTPVISSAIPQTAVLWPPNHQMVDLEISYDLSDNCGATASLTVTSNEPQTGTGNGDQPKDWEILDAHHLRLRAERSGNGNGRTYTITITAVDVAGNTATKQVLVTVPHNNGSSKQKLKARAYPNPFSSSIQVFVEPGKHERATLRILDAHGRVVESRLQVAPNSTIQLGADYKPGLYLIEITQGKSRQTLQVLKLQGNSSKLIN